MNNIEKGRTGTNNRWNQAIAGGAFDDDDAAVVAGQRELANGQLARMRRAADLSYMAVNRGIEFNDRRLRQNNGQVAPRAQFSRGERGPARAGLAHSGNGPVQLRGANRTSHHAPQPATESSKNSMLPSANKPSQASSSGDRPRDGDRLLNQLATIPAISSAPQDDIPVSTTTVSLKMSNGYSVLFQAPVKFASPAFLDRTAEYPGTIYLVAGPTTTDDEIILHIDEDRVDDVKRRAREYFDYLSDSDRLILQFKDSAGLTTWFVVLFRSRDAMVSFVDALRTFVSRQKEPSLNQTATVVRPPTVDPSAVPVDFLVDTSTPIIHTPKQQDTTKAISIDILESIVSWSMHIVAFIRDSGPAELANADALPGIIRGAAAAVLMEKHAGFSDLDSKQRVAFIDEVCAPQVFERFKRRMLENAPQRGSTESIPTIASSTQKSPIVQETTSSERPRSRYSIHELMLLENAAVDPPEFLTELRYLPEMNPENRALIEQIIRQAHGPRGASLPVQTAQVPDRTSSRAPHTNTSKAGGHSLDGHVSPDGAGNVGSHKSGAVPVQAAPVLSASSPSITVTAPAETPCPDEPLVAIRGEMNGLNSSRHNRNGVDLLGQSAKQFTGVLSTNKSHMEDLMLLDRVENFEVIRANDPEVAEIADRFARVHFDDGLPQ